MSRIKRKVALVTLSLLLLALLPGCAPGTTPSSASPSPPVFSNIEDLRPAYYSTMHFTLENDNYSHVFGSLPEILESEFFELTLETSLPAVPEKLMTYQIIRPEVDESYAQNLAKRLGFNGEPEVNTKLAYPDYRFYNGNPTDDSTRVLSIFKDGSISCWYSREKPVPSSLPSEEDSIKIARAWLGTYNLYPENILKIETSPFIQYWMQDNVKTRHTMAISVSFLSGLDGYELFGMGVYFLIGDEGKILEVHVNAPEFEPYSHVQVQPPETSLDTLQDYLSDPSKIRLSTPECLIPNIYRDISVKNISLKYFGMLNNDGSQTTYAQPVYIIEVQGKNGSGLASYTFPCAVDAVIR